MTVDVVDGLPGALGGGIVFGGAGYLVSLVLGPSLVAVDTHVRKNRMEFDAFQGQACNNAQSLLQGSSVPASHQKAELLRAAQARAATPPHELLRSVPSEEEI